MKTQFSQQRLHGSVLLVTLVITGILGFTLASYLTLIGNQNRSVVRSQNWNTSIPLAEAGIEEAIVHLNKNCTSNDITRDPVNWNADGWTTVANGVSITRWLGTNYYTVTISTNAPFSPSRPAIFSEGYVPAILAYNSQPSLFAAVGTSGQVNQNQPQFVGRKVRVTTSQLGIMTSAMTAKDSIDFNGNGVTTDSFDSENPAYSTGGKYDPAKNKDNGDVAVNFGLINTLGIGNADIYGKVAVGPGGSISIGPNGRVGDKAWNASNTGIQPGRSRDDMNVSFPDVKIPFTGGFSTPSGRTVTNDVITSINTTNTTPGYPTGLGIIYTNTVTTNTVSYPVGGTYIGSVNTNTTYTTTVGLPSSGTYIGTVATNTATTTSSNAPASGSYIGNVTTNLPTFTTTTYPSSPYGPVTTNTSWTTTTGYPAAGTYVGSVTINRKPSGTVRNYSYNLIAGYTYQKITGYSYEQLTGYSYLKINGYTVARIVSYSLVQSSYTTNYVAKYYDFVLDSGNYKIANITGDVLVLGDSVLYVTSGLTMNQLQINPTARLKLYMGGASTSINGNKYINASGNADNFWYFGLPTNTDISFGGNGGFIGVIYAPQADFHLGGGGNDTKDFIGATLTKSVHMNGHFNFHYDEALARKGASRGYVIDSWEEVSLETTR